MPRKHTIKNICKFPTFFNFKPSGRIGKHHIEYLTLDEFESIRLVDYEGVSREKCAIKMNVSRTTAQEIYNSARAKIASCLINGYDLRIEGGDYKVCDGSRNCPNCCLNAESYKNIMRKAKENEKNMRIAVTFENGEVFQHFGRCEHFMVYEVENGKVVDSHIEDSNGIGHGALAGLLANNKVDLLICGGIGGGALAALKACNIEVISGSCGSVENVMNTYLAGKLTSTGGECTHHEHHHGEGHECGHHGCGEHGCH